jgi:hypothetical protein
MSSNRSLRNATIQPNSTVAALARRLRRCRGSEEYVDVIRALVATRNPAAIRPLASLLDSVGPIAEEAIAGLRAFGVAVVPAMRACVDSLDYAMIRHGHLVLASLGDPASRQWLRDDDAERAAAYRERLDLLRVPLAASVANETDAPKATA